MKKKLLKRLSDERLKMFWSFITERQNIYWKRGQGKPRPWTDDPILDKHFFCNVYRELDRGTQYCINNILYRHKKLSDVLFRVIMYRLFNEPMTYELLKPMLGNYNGRKAGALLDRKHAAGIRIFRSAWMTSAAGLNDKSKANVYCHDMQKVYNNIDGWCDDVVVTTKIEDAWNIISKIKWIGSFAALQIVLDLSYLPFFVTRWRDLNTWVYPGPGAKKGIAWLMGHDPVKSKGAGIGDIVTEKECAILIRHLQRRQDSYFRKYGLRFKRWEGKKLDVQNIEFSLCEFQKYMRASRGGKKRHFVPNTKEGK